MSASNSPISAITGDIRANTHTPLTQWDPSVTALTNGKFVAVWTSANQEGVDTSVFAQHRGGVYGQIFNGDGTRSGEEFLVNTIILGDQSRPNVAALSGGGFVVSYDSNPGFGNEYDVRARVYNGTGSPVGAEFELTSSSAAQSNLTIAARPGGGFVATWLEGAGGTGNVLKARVYDNSGAPIGTQVTIAHGPTELESFPGITALANGDYIVTWMRGPNDGSGSSDIMAARFDVNGNTVTAPFVVNDNAATTQGWMPQAAQLTDGRTVIAWSDGGIFSSDVRFKIFNPNGSLSQAETVVTPAGTVERAVDIIALADGGFLVTYESTASGNGQIMAQRYLASGVKLGDAEVINEVDRGPDQQVSYNTTVPGRIDQFFGTAAQTVSQLTTGELVVVWQGTDPASASNGIDVYTRVFAVPAYTAQNDAPVVTSAATASFAENGTGIAYQASATDAEGQAIIWSLTGADAARFTINAAGAVRFVAAPDFEAPADAGANNVYDINVVASDGTTSTPRAVAISVTNVAEAPTLTGFGPAVTVLENAVNAAPALLDADVVFTAGGALAGGRLVVSGLLAEDRVSVLNEGNAAGQIGVAGTAISFGGTVIGTASGGVGGDFTVTFAAGATTAAVDALIQRLAYGNVSDTPTATRSLTINVIDGAGLGLPTVGVGGLAPLTGSANPFNGIDVGFSAVPAFFDLDGDGDRDLVVGESGGTILSWRNTGTNAAPVFTALTGAANPFNGIDVGLNATPSFVDLNGDGRLDLVSGVNTGAFQAWQNTGTNAAPVFTPLTGVQNPFNGFVVGNWSQVSFTDLDGDGDPDLVAGEGNGAILAWRNIGTAAAPNFQALSGAGNPFNGIDVGLFSRPAFVDLDGDGVLDLVSGEQQGALLAWRNTGTSAAPVYTQLTGAANPFNGLDVGQLSTPVFVDLDGDRDLDLVSGNFDGQIVAWRNNAVSPASITVTVTAQVEPFIL